MMNHLLTWDNQLFWHFDFKKTQTVLCLAYIIRYRFSSSNKKQNIDNCQELFTFTVSWKNTLKQWKIIYFMAVCQSFTYACCMSTKAKCSGKLYVWNIYIMVRKEIYIEYSFLLGISLVWSSAKNLDNKSEIFEKTEVLSNYKRIIVIVVMEIWDLSLPKYTWKDNFNKMELRLNKNLKLLLIQGYY